jgi:hypothetical protein
MDEKGDARICLLPVEQGQRHPGEDGLMEQRIYVIGDVVASGQRKRARTPGVASTNPRDWTGSSMDLKLGLDIVELADSQWSNTQALDRELTRAR